MKWQFLHIFAELGLKKHPAFWIGLLLLGFCGLGIGWSWAAILPWLAVLLFPWIYERNWPALLGSFFLGTLCFFYASSNTPIGPKKEVKGIGYFRISWIKEEESAFGKVFSYRGKVLRFQGDSGEMFCNLPCCIYVKNPKNRPKGDHDFLLSGSLSPRKYGRYVFKTKKVWEPVKGTLTLAEWRYKTKQKTKKYLERHFGHSKTLALFSALALGDIDDREMASDFKNLGISHLLAISGFHFALVSSLIAFVLKFFFSIKLLSVAVCLLCSCYAIFLGPSPSILRAWSALSLFLFANFLDLRTTGLNALGLGLILEICFDPLIANQIGFGLSFLATCAILLLYSPFENFLSRFFLRRKLAELEKFTFFEKHLYLISSFFRKSLALNLSVHLLLIPACIFFFHSFTCLSLIYNLFFPFLIGLSLSFLFLTIPVDLLLPPLGFLLHKANLFFTQFLIDITAYPPFAGFRLCNMQITPLVFSVSLFFLIGSVLYFDKKRTQRL